MAARKKPQPAFGDIERELDQIIDEQMGKEASERAAASLARERAIESEMAAFRAELERDLGRERIAALGLGVGRDAYGPVARFEAYGQAFAIEYRPGEPLPYRLATGYADGAVVAGPVLWPKIRARLVELRRLVREYAA